MEDLGSNLNKNTKTSVQSVRKIPLINMDLHYYSHRTIQRFIDEGLLPKTNNTLIFLDSHGDEIVPDDMNVLTPLRARSARHGMYRDYCTGIWIKEAVEAGILKNIIWAKPPWNVNIKDGHRDLENGVSLDVKTIGKSIFENIEEDFDGFQKIFDKHLSKGDPYILDMEFNFFSANSPHADMYYEKCKNHYSNLKELFKIPMPSSNSEEDIQKAVDERYKQLNELKYLFNYLHENRNLPAVDGVSTENYKKVVELREDLLKHYADDNIKWNDIYENGNYASDYIIPVHDTKRDDILRMIQECLGKLLDLLPSPPSLIIMAVMYDYDRYTFKKNLKFITKSLEDFFKSRYDVKIEYSEF